MAHLLYIHFWEDTIWTMTVQPTKVPCYKRRRGLSGLTGSICYYGITEGKHSVKDVMSFGLAKPLVFTSPQLNKGHQSLSCFITRRVKISLFDELVVNISHIQSHISKVSSSGNIFVLKLDKRKKIQ